MIRAVIRAHPAGEPVEGLWCDPCALPSVVGLVVLLTAPGCRLTSVALAQECRDCGRRELAP